MLAVVDAAVARDIVARVNEDDPEARRAARASWPVRMVSLHDDDCEPMAGTVGERLAATWELTQQAWAIAGLPMPTYERSQIPVCWRRLGEEPR